MSASMRIDIAGENTLIVYFAEVASEQSAADVFTATQALEELVGHGVIDFIPSYASLLVIYDDDVFDFYAMRNEIVQRLKSNQKGALTKESRLVALPVYYGTDAGPDLAELAETAKLSIAEVIEIHQSQAYQVFAIGFAPGFAFLGEVDPRIAAPRKSTPRKAVPKGAVAIADRQTAVYPSVSPGGWNLIGLCPTPMFDAKATPCMPVEVGDKVKFYAISKDEYLALGGEL